MLGRSQMVIRAATFLFLACPAVMTDAQDWTRFRGPGGHGGSDATTIPAEVTHAHINWRIELPGRGHSSPVVVGDRIFLTWERKDDGVRAIGCISATDGAILWQYEEAFQSYEHHRDNSFASSTPAVDSERVYCFWSSGEEQIVLALSHDGEQLWRKSIGRFGAQWGTGSSPILAGGVLIVTNDNEEQPSFLMGLDPKTGDERWRRDRVSSRSSYATPIVLEQAETRTTVLFASTSHGLTCLDARTGALMWELDGLFRQRCVGSPVLAGDVIYQLAGSGGGGKEGYIITPPSAAGAHEPAIHKRLTSGLPYVPTPVVYESRVFFFADSGVVSCLEAGSGSVIWKERLGGRFYGSPVRVGGHLYCMSREGELFVLEAGDAFRLTATLDLGEGSSSTPAVAGGVMYLRTERHLMSIGGRVDDQNQRGEPARAPRDQEGD